MTVMATLGLSIAVAATLLWLGDNLIKVVFRIIFKKEYHPLKEIEEKISELEELSKKQ